MSIIQERRKRRNQNIASITDDPRRKALLNASEEKLHKRTKSSSSTYLTETASEADAHYENALSKQYGNLSPSQLREKIEDNERARNNTNRPDVAAGYERQNKFLARILNDKEIKPEINFQYDQNQNTVQIQLSDKKSISLNYKTAKAIDDYIDKNKKEDKRKLGDMLDHFIRNLNLSDTERKNAESYVGLRKLSLASEATGKNNAAKELSQPIAKFLAGMHDAADSFTRVAIKSSFGLDGGEYNDAWNDTAKFYKENPDILGHDLLKGKSSYSTASGASDDYLSKIWKEKKLEWDDDTTAATKLISEGFRSAGNTLGNTAIAAGTGMTGAVKAAGTAVRNAAAGTKIGSVISKAANASPNIKNISDNGIKGKAVNAVINKVNKASASSIAKFLNPFDNPTTALMGISVAQDKYNELRQNGYDKKLSAANALFTGYINAITEKMGYDGTPESLFLINGKTAAGSAAASKAKNAKNILRNYLSSNVSEGMEEIYATVFERAGDLFSKVGYEDENGNLQQRKVFGSNGIFDARNAGESFLGGFVGGAVMGSVGLLSNIAANDVDVVRKYARTIKSRVDAGNQVVSEMAKKAGVEDVHLPAAPDYKTATVKEINDFYERTVKSYGEILSDKKVIENDKKIVERADSENEQKIARAVKNSVLHGIAKNAASIVGDKGDTKPLMKSNAEFISDKDNLITPEYIHDYAKFFTKSLEAISSPTYERLQDKTKDLTGELVRFATGASVSPELAGDADFVAVSEPFQGKLNGAIRTSQALHNLIYGENAALDAQVTQYTSGNKSVIENPILPAQNSDYIAQTANSDIKFSIDEDFEANYDKWVKNGRRNDISLTVGRTSEALKSVGVEDKNITFDSGKINKILKKHLNMSDDVIKQIPTLLENPVLIMDSLQSKSRITILGEVYDSNGKPVLAVLELNPKNRGNIVLDEIKIASAYGKNNVQSLINRSNILYIEPDKNRTDSWLAHNRLQLPLGQLNYGSIKSITYPEGNVNSYSMQSAENDAESGEKYGRNDILRGDAGRGTDESAGEQTHGVSKNQFQAKGKTKAERTSAAEEIRAGGKTKSKIIVGDKQKVRFDVIEESAYNEDMKSMVSEAMEKGYQIKFFIGAGEVAFDSGKNFRVDGLVVNGKEIYLRYDGAYAPQSVNLHEFAHKDFKTPEMKNVTNHILNSLSDYEKQKILQSDRYQSYMELYDGNEEKVWEEFLCDTLAGMNNYTQDYAAIVNDYWNNRDIVDFYSAADYKGMKDSGGENENIIGNIGFGDEITLSTSSNGIDDIEIYDYTKPFAEQVEDWKQGKIPQNDTLLVGGTPEVLKEIGFNALPVTMNQTHVDYAYNGKNGDIKSDHVIKDLIKDLPEKLEHPLAVIASDSKPGRVVALLGLNNPNTGYKVVVPVEVDGFGTQNNISIDSNALTSVYGRKNALVQLKEAIENDSVNDCRLFYWNKNEAVSLLQAQGLQLPNHLPQDGFVHSIRENGSKVNMKFENETESQQFKRWFGDWKKNPNRASKVVNADGTPKVVYHGSAEEFFAFDKQRRGIDTGARSARNAFFFTDSESVATGYAELAYQGSGKVYQTYLDIKNPLVYDFQGNEFRETTYNDLIHKAKSQGNDGVIFLNTYDASNTAHDEMCTVYAVFEPEQIKSATENIGTFDRNNPDIRYSIDEDSDYIFQNLETQEEYDKALKQLLERYGSVLKGENSSRDISVPKKIAKDRPVSQFARTMMEAGVTPDEAVSEFERMILDGTMTHEIISNKSAKQRAKERHYGRY